MIIGLLIYQGVTPCELLRMVPGHVQYMAGHKYVSSTERYQQNNLNKLQRQLEKYHPLEQNNKWI